MNEPRWHGWATPDQVRQMMRDMAVFLLENNEWNEFASKVEVITVVYEVGDADLRCRVSKLRGNTRYLGQGGRN